MRLHSEKTDPLITVSFHLPASVRDTLRDRAREEGKSQSVILTEALRIHFGTPFETPETRRERIEEERRKRQTEEANLIAPPNSRPRVAAKEKKYLFKEV
jgi:hypothetical protein